MTDILTYLNLYVLKLYAWYCGSWQCGGQDEDAWDDTALIEAFDRALASHNTHKQKVSP